MTLRRFKLLIRLAQIGQPFTIPQMVSIGFMVQDATHLKAQGYLKRVGWGKYEIDERAYREFTDMQKLLEGVE